MRRDENLRPVRGSGADRFHITADVSRLAAQVIFAGPESHIDEERLTAAVRLEFNGRPPAFPAGSHHVRSDGSISPVKVFPFIPTIVDKSSRLLRHSSEENASLNPTHYSLGFAQAETAVRVSLLCVDAAHTTQIAEVRLPAVEVAGSCWMLAKSMARGILSLNPALEEDPLIESLSEGLDELLELLRASGWRGPFRLPSL